MCRQHADGIFNYLDSSLTDTHETEICFVGILTQNDTKRMRFVYPPRHSVALPSVGGEYSAMSSYRRRAVSSLRKQTCVIMPNDTG